MSLYVQGYVITTGADIGTKQSEHLLQTQKTGQIRVSESATQNGSAPAKQMETLPKELHVGGHKHPAGESYLV